MAISYVCDKTEKGAVALFQRYTNDTSLIVSGGHFEAKCDCALSRSLFQGYATTAEFLAPLSKLLKGENIIAKSWGTVCDLALVKEGIRIVSS